MRNKKVMMTFIDVKKVYNSVDQKLPIHWNPERQYFANSDNCLIIEQISKIVFGI